METLNQSKNKPLLCESEIHERDMWPSRSAFLFNAIGTTVGIGSMWRFPALTLKYGGCSFIFPYLIALIFIGYPLLLLEIGMGAHFQTGDIGVFGSIHKRLRGCGLASVLGGLMVIAYYIPLLSWVAKGYVKSFGKDLGDEISASDALDFFFLEVIGMASLGDDLKPTRIVWENVAYIIFSWCCIGALFALGMKYVGRLAYLTMALLCINVCIFLSRIVTVESLVGLHEFVIGQWDWSILREQPDVWSVAVVEIFFTLGGCTFGLMTAMSSHCHPKHCPAAENASIIALSNIFFNFVAAIGTFSVMKNENFNDLEQEFEEVADSFLGGAAIIFDSYPGGLPSIPLYWCRLLILNLFLLGIDNAFAFVGTIRDAISDSFLGKKVPDIYVLGFTIGCCIVTSSIYTTDAGLILLDVVDFYINYIMLLVGIYKAISAGWVYGIEGQMEMYGQKIVYTFVATTFGSLNIACFIWFMIERETIWLGFITYLVLYALGMSIIIYMIKAKNMTVTSVLYELYFGNVLDLKSKLESSVGKIPTIWPFLLKHFIPQALIVLFMNLAYSENNEGTSDFGHYRGYSFWPFQFLGLGAVFVIIAVSVLGIMKPDIFQSLTSVNERDLYASASRESSKRDDNASRCTSYIENAVYV